MFAIAACGATPAPIVRPAHRPARPVPIPLVIAEVVPEPEPAWVKHDPAPSPDPVPPPIPPKPYAPKSDRPPFARETLDGHEPPPRAATLPEEVIVKLMDTGRLAFVRCFKKAVDADPTTLSFKVRLHVELDAGGAIVAASAGTPDHALATCLVRIARILPYPAPGKRAVVDLPLLYRAE